jgi:hypothetical protein
MTLICEKIGKTKSGSESESAKIVPSSPEAAKIARHSLAVEERDRLTFLIDSSLKFGTF